MARQLNVRSDEAYALARGLARRLNPTATEIVEAALREYRTRAVEPALSPEQQSFVDEMLSLGAKARAELLAQAEHHDISIQGKGAMAAPT